MALPMSLFILLITSRGGLCAGSLLRTPVITCLKLAAYDLIEPDKNGAIYEWESEDLTIKLVNVLSSNRSRRCAARTAHSFELGLRDYMEQCYPASRSFRFSNMAAILTNPRDCRHCVSCESVDNSPLGRPLTHSYRANGHSRPGSTVCLNKQCGLARDPKPSWQLLQTFYDEGYGNFDASQSNPVRAAKSLKYESLECAHPDVPTQHRYRAKWLA